MKRQAYYRHLLMASLITIFGIQTSHAFNTTNYKITVKNNSDKVLHMKLGKGVGTTSGECVHNITSKLDDVKLDSGAVYNFELAFKGGDQFYIPDGSGGSFGVPLGCTKGDKDNETTIHFDYFIDGNSDSFAHVMLQDYSDSDNLMRCSAVTKSFGFGLMRPGMPVIGCSANRRSGSHQTATIYINDIPNDKEKSQ